MKNKRQKKATPALTLGFGKKICPKSKHSQDQKSKISSAIQNKSGQEQKYKILVAMPKKAQEEMIGFALIIILVAVILLIFLGFSLRSQQKETIESYEVESFIQSFLQYTSDCRDNLEYLSIKKLIFDCSDGETCLDGRNTCEVLNSTLKEILDESWRVGGNFPYKRYELNITLNSEDTILFIEKGDITNNYKWSMQDFSRSGNSIEIFFTAYY